MYIYFDFISDLLIFLNQSYPLWVISWNNLFNYSSLLRTFINAITLSTISWHLHNHFVFSGCGLVSARKCLDLLRGTLDALCAWRLTVSWEPIVVTSLLTVSKHILMNICTRVLGLLICGRGSNVSLRSTFPGVRFNKDDIFVLRSLSL